MQKFKIQISKFKETPMITFQIFGPTGRDSSARPNGLGEHATHLCGLKGRDLHPQTNHDQHLVAIDE
jgi:hypothetical protein